MSWQEEKKIRKAKRAANRVNSLSLLLAAGLKVDIHNSGAHLVVHAPRASYDFWPGTGLFRKRGEVDKFRGVKRLLAMVGEDNMRVGYGRDPQFAGPVTPMTGITTYQMGKSLTHNFSAEEGQV